jgi:hypothetical protein
MRSGSHRYPLTMSIHPTSRGFGWVAFEGPFTPYDWGIVFANGSDKNGVCLRAAEKLVGRMQPETLVLEDFGRRTSSRANRIVRLCQSLVGLATDRGAEVVILSRADIQASFSHAGARSRQEIAEAVCRHVDAFRYRLPSARRIWESEDRRMGLFSAAALVLAYFRR